jgi:hypothetical protein
MSNLPILYLLSKEKSTALGCILPISSYIVLFEPEDMFKPHFEDLSGELAVPKGSM